MPNKSDPTNQGRNRRKANTDNNRRLTNANKEVLALWRGVKPKRVVKKDIKNNVDFYEYDTTINQVQVQTILDRNLETAGEVVPFAWYFSQYNETAFRSGVIQENAWIAVVASGSTSLAGGATVTLISTDALLSSPAYRQGLDAAIDNSYRLIRNLSNNTTNQIIQVVNNGVNAGLSRSQIAADINERFSVAKSSSTRIIDTEINRNYNDARMGAIDAYNENGDRLGVMHISALLATTRSHHAARHGSVYTREAQSRWWDSGTNRIRCHCSVRAAQVTSKNDVVDKKRQEAVIDRGKAFFKRVFGR